MSSYFANVYKGLRQFGYCEIFEVAKCGRDVRQSLLSCNKWKGQRENGETGTGAPRGNGRTGTGTKVPTKKAKKSGRSFGNVTPTPFLNIDFPPRAVDVKWGYSPNTTII